MNRTQSKRCSCCAVLLSSAVLVTIAGGDVCQVVVDEPGADICTPSYPDNFVPFSQVYEGFAAGCGGADVSVGIGYRNWPFVTFATDVIDVERGDEIIVSYTGWASGSTGSIEIEVSVSADNNVFVSCGVALPRNFLGNSQSDTVICPSPFDAETLYVRPETVTLSPALVYIRTMDVAVCKPKSCTGDLDGSGIVDAADLAILLGGWGFNPGHPADFNGDGLVNAADLAVLLGMWGPC